MTIKTKANSNVVNLKGNTNDVPIDQHHKKTMALLKELLNRKGWNQRQLAKELHKDTTTINRWAKNSRDIRWDQALEIAKVINCHPIELYEPTVDVFITRKCAWNGYMVDVPKNEQEKINIPFEWYNDEVLAAMMDSPGTPMDGEVWLFDIPKKTKKIDKNCVGKVCYIAASETFKKRNNEKLKFFAKKNNIKPIWHPLCAMISPTGNGKLKIINSHTQELINDICDNLSYNDFEVAAPVKARFDPERV